MEQRLASYSSFVWFGVKLKVVKSVLSSLLTYYLGTLKLPDGVKEYIGRARRICLWGKYEATGYCQSLQQHRSILNEASLLNFFHLQQRHSMGQTYLEILPKLGAACHRPDWFILDQKSIMKLNTSCRSIYTGKSPTGIPPSYGTTATTPGIMIHWPTALREIVLSLFMIVFWLLRPLKPKN